MDFFANPLHLFLLIIVIVLVFGANKIGDVGGALGKSIREFKKEANKEKDSEELQRTRVQTPPTAAYVPPPVISQQPAEPVHTAPLMTQAPSAPAQPANVAPGDYRPSVPSQGPTSGPPEFPGS